MQNLQKLSVFFPIPSSSLGLRKAFLLHTLEDDILWMVVALQELHAFRHTMLD